MLSLTSLEPVLSHDHLFETPAKLIKSVQDMAIWEKSEAYHEYTGFILAINEAVRGKSNSQGSAESSSRINKVVALLNKLDRMIDEIPPIQQPQRFGNQAFRTWYQSMSNKCLQLLQECLPDNCYRAVQELTAYFLDSFGNATRIDYGTGHEMAFVMFLCALFKIGMLSFTDRAAAGCLVFPRYLQLVRKLQTVYRMEPAGSHGVWSLDDYQFVPFIWGSAQLVGHKKIEPASFLQASIVNTYSDDYMFLGCIAYINSVKTGPFAEHSNQLWSISGVSSWSKINGGLVKMYKAEVLSKFPVIQHIVFGSLFTLSPVEHKNVGFSEKPSVTRPVRSVHSVTDNNGSQKSEGSEKKSDTDVVKKENQESEETKSGSSDGNDNGGKSSDVGTPAQE